MVNLFIIFLIFTSVLQAEIKAGFDTIGFGLHSSQDIKDSKTSTTIYNRNSEYILLPHLVGKKENETFGYDFEFMAPVKENFNGQFPVYSGGNSYLYFNFKGIQFEFGRKEFTKLNPFTPRDGSEGVKLSYTFKEKFILECIAFDYYRGFPLYEYEFALKESDPIFTKGNRARHGIGLAYNGLTFSTNIQFLYLNLGDWGHSSKDDARKNPTGDEDFLYQGKFDSKFTSDTLDIYLTLLFSRGLDKTISNPERKEKSLPITGEAVRFGATMKFNIFKLSIHGFLPDRDKRNSTGEVLEMGYVGTGTNPTSSVLLAQELNFYPAAWVTREGLEKQNSYYSGRRNSFAAGAKLGFEYKKFSLYAVGDHYTPYLESGASNGSISIRKKDFSKSFLVETGIELQFCNSIEKDFFLKLRASRLFSSKDISIEGSYLSVQGGVFF
jgi:hypothetical protein